MTLMYFIIIGLKIAVVNIPRNDMQMSRDMKRHCLREIYGICGLICRCIYCKALKILLSLFANYCLLLSHEGIGCNVEVFDVIFLMF